MTVSVYQQTNTGVNLDNVSPPTVVVQLRVPNTGTYLVLGRLAVDMPLPVGNAVAYLTTLDGATVLDQVGVTAAGGKLCIALQGTLNVTAPNSNEIVDIRCSGIQGVAERCSLIAISVDQLSGSLSSVA
jgi:hypothetical protein